MQTTINKLPHSEIEILVEISKEEFRPYLEQASKKISKDANIPGFRPGFVPYEVLKTKLNPGDILSSAAEFAIGDLFVKTIKEKNIAVLGRPEASVQKLSEDEFGFKVVCATVPEVELADYKEIAKKIKKDEVKITEKDLAESLSWLAKSRAAYTRVLRSAKKGDRVEIDYEVSQNGKLMEGGSVENQRVELGETHLLPGIEEHILGASENEVKTFSVMAPSEFPIKELRGQPIDFKVTIKGVFEAKISDINDAFAKSVGKFENLNDLKKSISDGLIAERESAAIKKWERDVVDAIADESKMDISPRLIEAQKDMVLHQMEHNVHDMGSTMDEYLNHLNTTMEKLRESLTESAQKQVRATFVLEKIAHAEKISASKEEIESQVNQILKYYKSKEEAEKHIHLNELKDNVCESIIQDKTYQVLKKLAGIEIPKETK